MQILTQKDRLIYIGSVRQFRSFLRTLPTDITLKEYLRQRLH